MLSDEVAFGAEDPLETPEEYEHRIRKERSHNYTETGIIETNKERFERELNEIGRAHL